MDNISILRPKSRSPEIDKQALLLAREYPTIPHRQLAIRSGLPAHALNNAKRVLKHGTPEEIAGVIRGDFSLQTVARYMRDGLDADQRILRRAGKLPTQKQEAHGLRKQLYAPIIRQLQQALDILVSMPSAQDVAGAVARLTEHKHARPRITRASTWMRELEEHLNNVG